MVKLELIKLILWVAFLLQGPVFEGLEASQTPTPSPGPTDPLPKPTPPSQGLPSQNLPNHML